MYQNKIALSPQDILEKEFKIDTRGYRLKEVDQFLDIIMDDYQQFINIINSLETEKSELLAEIMNLKQQLRNSELANEIVKGDASSMPEVTNVDIMRRLSHLEKMVYNLKSDDTSNQ
mgnify:FL=1